MHTWRASAQPKCQTRGKYSVRVARHKGRATDGSHEASVTLLRVVGGAALCG
jgi:hypothetical protein